SLFLLIALLRPVSYTLSLHDALPILRGQVLLAGQAGFTESGSKILGRPAAEKSPVRSGSVGTVVVNTVPWRRQNARAISPLPARSEEHTSELQSRFDLVCRLLLEKKK